MNDNIFGYMQSLKKIIRKHADALSFNNSDMTALQANEEICKLFFEILKNNSLGFRLDMEIYTFRNRRGSIKSSLRSIHSEPDYLADIFNNPEDVESFDFVKSSFNNPISLENLQDQEILFELYENINNVDMTKGDKNKFDKRIKEFLSKSLPEKIKRHNDIKLEKSELANKLNNIKGLLGSGCCLVIGRIIKTNSKPDEKLHDLFAIYCKDFPSDSINKKNFRDCLWSTFSAFEEIEKQDRAFFLKQSMRVVNSHMKKFSDRSNPPADNMSSLLNELQLACTKHPSMGCGTKKNDIKVRFVRVEFIEESENGKSQNQSLYPRQFFYPPEQAQKDLTSTVIFSHKKSKTIVKYLLWKWLESYRWKIGDRDIHDDFKKIFDKSNERPPSEYSKIYLDEENKRSSHIYATNLNTNDWGKFNFSSQVNTTVAFIVYNNTECDDIKKAPYGILAFESEVIDAFSEEDINVFETISESLGVLLDISNFGSPFIDFSKKLRKAVIAHDLADITNKKLAKIIYEIQRLDLELLKNFLENDIEKTTQKQLFQKDHIKSTLNVLFDNKINEDKSSDLIDLIKKNNIIKHIEEKIKTDKSSDDLLHFLESIPSNSNWHARLMSIPRALSERALVDPEFQRYQTGFSSDAIYILRSTGQISQIVKFSDRISIKREREAYQKFVRYYIPLAARISANGYAIETSGKSDPSKGFGVLISDLIAGQNLGSESNQYIKSLADLCLDELKENFKKKSEKKKYINEKLKAVAYHFTNNSKRWREPVSSEHLKDINEFIERRYTYQDIIQDSSRLLHLYYKNDEQYKGPSRENHEFNRSQEKILCAFFKELTQLLDATISQLKPSDGEFSSLQVNTTEDLGGLFSCWESKMRSETYIDKSNEMITIIHGDLNSQNLTWSDYYEKFQIIDFEHVRPGYRNSDQLKLIFSMLKDLHQRLIKTKLDIKKKKYDDLSNDAKKESPERYRPLYLSAKNIQSSILVIYSFALCLKKMPEAPYTEDVEAIISNFFLENISAPLARLFRVVIGTIFLKDAEKLVNPKKTQEKNYFDLDWSVQINSLKIALQCFSLKEISYSLNDLEKDDDSNDFKRIKDWTDAIKKGGYEMENPVAWFLSMIGDNDDLKKPNFNQDEKISALICSFLGYASVCMGLGIEWD